MDKSCKTLANPRGSVPGDGKVETLTAEIEPINRLPVLRLDI